MIITEAPGNGKCYFKLFRVFAFPGARAGTPGSLPAALPGLSEDTPGVFRREGEAHSFSAYQSVQVRNAEGTAKERRPSFVMRRQDPLFSGISVSVSRKPATRIS